MADSEAVAEVLPDDGALIEYYVVRGDTLFSIARRHATTVGMVKQANGLRGDRIYPGQVLKLPAR